MVVGWSWEIQGSRNSGSGRGRSELPPKDSRAEVSPVKEEVIQINATEIGSEQIANNGPHGGFAAQ